MAKIKSSDNSRCKEGCREVDHSSITDGNVKWSILEDGVHQLFKDPSINYPVVQQLHSWALSPRNENLCSHENLYGNVHSNFIYNSPKLGATQMSFNGWVTG